MFTGIVEELGSIAAIEDQGDAVRLSIRADLVLEDVALGDSISVNGCCLTVAQRDGETFTADVMRETLDKTSRFTDWSRRPLSEAQKVYALADVTHLRVVYEFLAAQIAKSARQHWVEEELSILTDPATYTTHPEEAWLRIKTRTNSGRFLALVQELARFREIFAQTNNLPRARVLKDDALLELASTRPTNIEELGRSRLLLRDGRRGDIADGLLAAVKAGMEMKPEAMPKPDLSRDQMQVNPALADLLRVLLKAKSESLGVAARLIASSADLDAIAAGMRDMDALSGWRAEAFGADAMRLCRGEIALTAKGSEVRVVSLTPVAEGASAVASGGDI